MAPEIGFGEKYRGIQLTTKLLWGIHTAVFFFVHIYVHFFEKCTYAEIFVHRQMYNFEDDVQKLFENPLKNHRKLYFEHKNVKNFPLRGLERAQKQENV